MKKAWPVRLLGAGVCAMAGLLLLWWGFRPLTSPPGSLRVLALKAAAGDPKAVSALQDLGSNAVPGLVQLLAYQEPFLRRQTRALASKLPRGCARALWPWVGPLEVSSVRVAGAKGLALLHSQADGAVPALLEVLHDPEPYVAMEAATALGRIGRASVPGLTRALGDKGPVVRHAAAYALGEIGPGAGAALPELIAALEDPDSQVRSSTAYTLTLIGYPAMTTLSNVIERADGRASGAAIKELILFYRSLLSMTAPLRKLAHAHNSVSRCQALDALGAIRAADEATIRTFIEAMQDSEVEVRLTALRALSQVIWRGGPAIGALRNCLRDPSASVRAWSAKDLGAIGPPARAALKDLTYALQDDEPAVRAAARQAMEEIEPKEPPTQ